MNTYLPPKQLKDLLGLHLNTFYIESHFTRLDILMALKSLSSNWITKWLSVSVILAEGILGTPRNTFHLASD